jgi:hypothetical protein
VNAVGGIGFSNRSLYPVGIEPVYVAVGDFDGDGIPELAVANSFGGDISVLLGSGDGSTGTELWTWSSASLTRLM